MAILAAASILMALMSPTNASHSDFGTPKILKFKDGAAAAVSLQFDDSMMSQLDNALPLLNSRGIHATFFVNTGSWQYGQRKRSWEIEVPKAGHEIANHTVHHTGAKTEDDLQAEIGGCSEYLATVFGPKPRLMSFATPGGVPWNFTKEQLDPIFKKYHLVLAENRNFFDETKTDPVSFVQKALDTGTWTNVAMHGTGGEWLSTSLPVLTKLLDFIYDNKSRLWAAPEIEVYKYTQERDAAGTPVLTSIDSDSFALDVTCTQSKLAFRDLPVQNLYDEPLTVEVSVPESWKSFHVKQGGQIAEIMVDGSHLARIPVRPNVARAIVSRT